MVRSIFMYLPDDFKCELLELFGSHRGLRIDPDHDRRSGVGMYVREGRLVCLNLLAQRDRSGRAGNLIKPNVQYAGIKSRLTVSQIVFPHPLKSDVET